MSDANTVLQQIKDEDVKFVDVRFTDPRGKWQHLAMDAVGIDEDTFTDGIFFDGSSIAGWKAINESDMTLMPDPESMVMDPVFEAQPTLIHELRHPRAFDSGQDLQTLTPVGLPAGRRPTCSSTGIGDHGFLWTRGSSSSWFDEVRCDVSTESHSMGYQIDARRRRPLQRQHRAMRVPETSPIRPPIRRAATSPCHRVDSAEPTCARKC